MGRVGWVEWTSGVRLDRWGGTGGVRYDGWSGRVG